jgi:hypothetical protein
VSATARQAFHDYFAPLFRFAKWCRDFIRMPSLVARISEESSIQASRHAEGMARIQLLRDLEKVLNSESVRLNSKIKHAQSAELHSRMMRINDEILEIKRNVELLEKAEKEAGKERAKNRGKFGPGRKLAL